MNESGAFDRWLRRATQVAATLLLLTVALVLWRVASLLEQVSQIASGLAVQVDHLVERVDELKQDTRQALHAEEIQMWTNQMLALRDQVVGGEAGGAGHGETLDGQAEAEIAHLLAFIGSDAEGFEAGDDEDSPAGFRLKASFKRQAYQRTIRTAEDFIEYVAKETFGEPYYVRLADDRRELVRDWLRRELSRFRTTQTQAQTSDSS